MGNVSRQNVGERTHGNSVAAGNPAARPRIVRQVPEESQRASPDCAKVLDVARPRKLIGISGRSGYFLIVARQLIGEPARKPKCPEEENALGVVDMVEQLAHGPLIGCVAVKRFFLGNSLQKVDCFRQLAFKDGDDVVAGYAIDVERVIGGGFVCFGTCGHEEIVNRGGRIVKKA